MVNAVQVDHEKSFYENHYKGGLSTADAYSESNVFQRCFSPGSRYALVDDVLPKYVGSRDQIVELGCAEGHTLTYCKKKYGFHKAVGVDIALPSSQVNDEGVEFITSNLNQGFPFSDRQVNVFMAMMCFEHLFCPFHTFSELGRCLALDGVAFINIPIVTTIKNRIRLAAGRLPITSVGYEHWSNMREWDGNHLHYFSLQSIHDLASVSDLVITNVVGVGRFHRLKTIFPSILAGELTFSLKHRLD